MFKEFSNNSREEDYLSEFRQKIANQQLEDMEERRHELQRSRNGFIGTIAGIVLAGLVSWFLLLPKFSTGGDNEIPVIRRPITPAKIQPNEPGGMEILNQDKSVYSLVEKKENTPSKVESLLPPPETPKMPVIAPKPKAETQTAANTEQKPQDNAAAPADQNKEVLEAKALDELIEEVQTTAGSKIDIPEKLPEIKVAAKTAAADKSKADKTAAGKPKTEKPVPTPAAAPAAQTGSGEIWQVQLLASSNKNAVESGWQNLSQKYNFLKQYAHETETVSIKNGKTLYRLKAGAFAARSEADSLCAKIKQMGGTCIVKKK